MLHAPFRLTVVVGLVAAVLGAAAIGPAPGAKVKTTAKPGPAASAGAAGDATAPATGLGIATAATHAFIIEADTGAVLLDKAAEERMPSASMSKMMTAYVVFGLLKQGRAKLDDTLPVSERAWKTGGSKMFVPLNGKVSIGDLLQGMIVDSGNDACLVLAEGLAGSEAAFVELMNQKAKEIGLTNSHFNNVTGLPDPDHWVTAHDLATLALRTIKDFPEYYHYYAQIEFAFNGIKQGNRNPLLYRNLGADGLKTGHTDEAGFGLTASVVRGPRRIVLVLSGLTTMKARGQESERLIDWAFRTFNDYSLFAAGAKVDDAEVWLGTEPRVALTTTRNVVVTLPRQSRKDMKVTVDYDGPVPAPIAEGQKIGKMVVSAPDAQPVEIPLVAGTSVARIGVVGRIATLAGYLVWGGRH